jgi:hypothetical protein
MTNKISLIIFKIVHHFMLYPLGRIFPRMVPICELTVFFLFSGKGAVLGQLAP